MDQRRIRQLGDTDVLHRLEQPRLVIKQQDHAVGGIEQRLPAACGQHARGRRSCLGEGDRIAVERGKSAIARTAASARRAFFDMIDIGFPFMIIRV